MKVSVRASAAAGRSTEFDLTPDTDTSAPEQVVRSIIQQVGRGSSGIDVECGARLRSRLVCSAARRWRAASEVSRVWLLLSMPVIPQTLVDAVNAWKAWLRQSASVGRAMWRRFTFDSSDHSGALLVGRPGSGKSTLLHTFIAGITTMYGPEELELHLIDFKEGVEFKVYAANSLPHARTVAIESDREFGVSVLQAIQAELAWRGSLLRGSRVSFVARDACARRLASACPGSC